MNKDEVFKHVEDLIDGMREEGISEEQDFWLERGRRAFYRAIYQEEPYWMDE